MGECPPGLSLDIIDVNGPYSPENCRWTDMKTQARNKTNNVLIEWQGEKVTLIELAEKWDIDYKRLHYLFRVKELPLEEIFIKHEDSCNG